MAVVVVDRGRIRLDPAGGFGKWALKIARRKFGFLKSKGDAIEEAFSSWHVNFRLD
jgi:hypothetical protein